MLAFCSIHSKFPKLRKGLGHLGVKIEAPIVNHLRDLDADGEEFEVV